MQMTRQIGILAGGGMATEAIKRLLEEEPSVACRMLEERDDGLFSTINPTDLILILPECWQQLHRWLPPLHKASPSCPWLITAEYRIAGMFVTSLQAHPCSLLHLHAPLDAVRATMEHLIQGSSMPPFPLLLYQFASHTATIFGRRIGALPTMREFEVGFAVSFGLTNEQIVQTLHIEETTVKSHLHHLFQKLRLSRRQELATYFNQALSVHLHQID